MGTATTTALTALQFNPSMVVADYATIDNALLNDQAPTTAPFNAANWSITWARTGQLYLPGGRGIINMRPLDFIAFDPQTGWPIVVSNRAASAAGWVHT
jgi:hypothetical protein